MEIPLLSSQILSSANFYCIFLKWKFHILQSLETHREERNLNHNSAVSSTYSLTSIIENPKALHSYIATTAFVIDRPLSVGIRSAFSSTHFQPLLLRSPRPSTHILPLGTISPTELFADSPPCRPVIEASVL